MNLDLIMGRQSYGLGGISLLIFFVQIQCSFLPKDHSTVSNFHNMPENLVNFTLGYDYTVNDNVSTSTGSKSFRVAHRENSINISPQNENLEVSVFDFGVVPNGSTSCKTLQIRNHTSKHQVYEIKRDPAARSVDNFIKVTSTPTVVGPRSDFVFQLSYFPQIPFTNNIDYFNVFDSEGLCMKFAAKGISQGPCLSTSGQKLTFITSQETTKLKRKVVELTNESNVLAQYTFDVDVRNSVFKPDPLLGYVKPHGSVYVGITFDPPGPGIYTMDLVCLVHYQSPLIIKLEAICTSSNTKLMWKNLNIVPIPQPYRVKHGFDWYFEHELSDKGSQHVLITRAWNIDFGSTLPASEDLPKHFTVRNTSKNKVLIKWCNDPNKIFRISPEEQVVGVSATSVFEVRFRPTDPDTLYSVDMSGHCFWNYVPVDEIDFANNQRVYMPIDLTARLMGQTFPPDGNGLTPHFEVIPKVVTLPACVPPLSTYSTFVINRLGIMPIMFKLLPPGNSRFSVRPRQGLIEKEFQLLVVKLCPGKQEGLHEELWTIRFNGMPHFDEKITFRGFTELPVLQTETDPVNVIHFPPTHPECVGYVDVPIRNLTRHCIRYKFGSNDMLTRVTMEGGETTIAPNQVVVQTWSFVPHEPGLRVLEVTLEAVALQDCRYPIGTPVESTILTYQHSQHANLVGFPRVLDFGPSWLEVTKRASFRLYNFGVCPIHYQLTCVQWGSITEDCADDVELLERWETVPPSSSVVVNAELRPSQRGLQEFVIFYQVREDASSNEVLDDEPLEVVRINYEGILPTMKVVELKNHTPTKSCTKGWLWRDLNLSRLNTLLATTMPNSSSTVHLRAPTAPLGSDTLRSFVYLRNIGELDAEWSVKRKQRCDCQRIQKTRGLSFREKLFECPHRDLFTMENQQSGKLAVGDLHTWTWLVQYTLEGAHELCYKLELSNNRKILICVMITVLPKDELHLCMVWPTLHFDNIYIGSLNPVLQLFWLYNNCLTDIDYEINTAQLRSINDTPFDINVLECMNPKSVVKALTAYPIYFKLDPYQMQAYEMVLPIRLGAETSEIRLCGNGSVNSTLYTKRQDVPIGGVVQAINIPLVFSIDIVTIAKPIPTHSKVDRIFFFRNQSAQLFSYEWLELRLENIICATVSPAKGLLQPFQTQICKMSIMTGRLPAMVEASFCVQTVNLSEKRNHENSVFMFREASRHLEQEFIITKKGMKAPINSVNILPKPIPWQFTISLKCQVMSPRDIEAEVPLRDQLKHATGIELDLKAKPTVPDVSIPDAAVITDELEKILWDEMSSKWLEETISSFSNDEPVYYSQFFMTRKQEASMKEKMESVPSRSLVKMILNNLVYQVLQEYFGFASVAEESDICSARGSSSKKINSSDIVKRSELDLSLRASSKLKIASDLGLKIKLPDAW